jgi:aquaporin Z
MKKYLAELLGTYALVLFGTGAIVVNDLTNNTITHVGVAIVFGAIVTAMIYSFGKISGAHINPAVTIGFWLVHKITFKEVSYYVIAQLIGGLLASITLWLLFPGHLGLGATLPLNDNVMQSFVLEVILTLFLMLTIIQVSSNKDYHDFTGVAVGLVVMLEAMFAGPITGASMNPARSIAPALVSGQTQHLWLYIVAPILGAVIAIGLWKYFSSIEKS